MLERIKDIIVQYVEIAPEEITEDVNIKNDLGMTSLALMNMVVELENEFDIEISEEAALDFETLGDIISYLKDNGAE